MGKNISGNTNKNRSKTDFYQTPYSLTRHLLKAEKFDGSILEPACGNGAITTILREAGYEDITAYDITTSGKDFLQEDRGFDNIITNPPYRLAQEFILHGLKIAKSKLVLLLPLSYLHSKKRYDKIFTKGKLEKVYIFTRYPMLSDDIRADGKHETGMVVYAWFVFNQNFNGSPTIDWFDNDKDVARKAK